MEVMMLIRPCYPRWGKRQFQIEAAWRLEVILQPTVCAPAIQLQQEVSVEVACERVPHRVHQSKTLRPSQREYLDVETEERHSH